MSSAPEKDVSAWWSNNPQTYGDLHGKPRFGGDVSEFGNTAFFDAADREFFTWNATLENKVPFDRIFPYERYRGMRVLEIGCGMGCMASLWARQGGQVTAVDLAPFSVEMTTKRFALMGLTGTILQADGRALPFDDGEFDYVYSWGVLHHSPDLAQSLREMMRVLKRGGEFGLMLYYRHSLFYIWRILYREGFVHNESDFLDPIALSSRYTDASEAEGNPHTWPVTRSELRGMLAPYANDLKFCGVGTETDHMLNLMLGYGRFLPRWVLEPWERRWSWSLFSSGIRN